MIFMAFPQSILNHLEDVEELANLQRILGLRPLEREIVFMLETKY